MDMRPKIEPVRVRKVLSVTFNDDKTCFSIGLEDGFMGEWTPVGLSVARPWICACSPLSQTVLRAEEGTVMLKKNLLNGIGLAQMRGVSNIIALVGGGQKPKFAANKASGLCSIYIEHSCL